MIPKIPSESQCSGERAIRKPYYFSQGKRQTLSSACAILRHPTSVLMSRRRRQKHRTALSQTDVFDTICPFRCATLASIANGRNRRQSAAGDADCRAFEEFPPIEVHGTTFLYSFTKLFHRVPQIMCHSTGKSAIFRHLASSGRGSAPECSRRLLRREFR